MFIIPPAPSEPKLALGLWDISICEIFSEDMERRYVDNSSPCNIIFLPLTYMAVPPSEAKDISPLLFTDTPGECFRTSKAFPMSVRYD